MSSSFNYYKSVYRNLLKNRKNQILNFQKYAIL